MCLARSLVIVKRKNKFKRIDYESEEKALRNYERLKRKGKVVQFIYN